MPSRTTTTSTNDDLKTGCLVLFLAALAIVLIVGLFKSVNTIDAGDEGVVVCFGQTSGHLDPGLHLVAPWCGVSGLDAHTQTYVMVAANKEGQVQGDDSLGVQSSDQVPLAVSAGVIYHIDRGQAENIYARFKPIENLTTVVRNTSRRVVHDAGATFAAQDLIGAKRADFGAAAEHALTPALAEFGVILERVEVRDVTPTSQSYVDAISAKVSGQQAAAAKEFQLQAAQKDAEIKRVTAEADAAAQAIRNSQPPDPRLLQQQYVDAIRNTNNKVIITDGKTPVLITPPGG
jgi:regulator of protease activity HflC (stomatin/prohibitin superfamily)